MHAHAMPYVLEYLPLLRRPPILCMSKTCAHVPATNEIHDIYKYNHFGASPHIDAFFVWYAAGHVVVFVGVRDVT